ncbi:MAG: transglycosylase SLT domain-containing protein [Proteobacteria bacterium]|nr:transglycosylase SLT domain-containing protein [Pseudomonadota bacterium]
MAKKMRTKVVVVREHHMRVAISKKNPSGVTIRDRHPRRIKGSYLDRDEIESTFKGYDRKGIVYSALKKLNHKNSDKYDDLIAVWTDYFNKKFEANPPLDPDAVKALIASESGFREDPPENKIAIGIAQITSETFKALQDPNGEVKDFIFSDIRKKDLKDPNINIPMAIRWLHRKKRLAEGKLGRAATSEEIILEYKGLLKSSSSLKNKALENFRKNYGQLKSK